MKILQINCVYNTGSTGKITADLHRSLQEQGVKSVVCYGRGKRVFEPGVYKVCSEWYAKLNNLLSRFTGVMYGGCWFSTRRLIKIIRRQSPDVVHLQCLNGYFVNIFKLVRWLNKNNIKTVLTLHAEFMFTANCGNVVDCSGFKTGCKRCPKFRAETKSLLLNRTGYAFQKMQQAFSGFSKTGLCVVSVSPWLMGLAQSSPILGGFCQTVVENGLDTAVFHPYQTAELKNELGLKNEKIIFHATAEFSQSPAHLKGGYYILKLAEQLREKNVKILVAGNCAENVTVPKNVQLLGKVSNQTRLAQLYSLADVTVITSKKETFSMICAESLCCGTPVVGFLAGGPESIALKEYCTFVAYGDEIGLEKAVTQQLQLGKNPERLAEKAAGAYRKESMLQKYFEIYKRLLK